jgi:ketosteroid isomerase-like protein
MSDLTSSIETLEHRWMRAWVNEDLKTLKSLTARDFILLTGSKPAAILDRPSWLEAAANRYLCSSYRFGDIYVRTIGSVALFATLLEVRASMDGRDWSGSMWISDLWRKGRVRRRWKLAQRIISRADEDPQLPRAIKSLQLWK